MTTLPDLDRLHADATPGPWRAGDGTIHDADRFLSRMHANPRADADFIAALRNAYPAIRAYVAALEEADRASRFILYGVVVTAGSETYLTKGDPVTCYRRLSEARLATDAAREKMEKQDG